MIKLGLIGSGISQSLTPHIFNAEARSLGIDLCYDFIDLEDSQYSGNTFEQIIEEKLCEGYVGFNVTYPFKTHAVKFVDYATPIVNRVGSLNTVYIKNGNLYGDNTDYSGFLKTLKNNFSDENGDHVILIGLGGAGVALAMALIEWGVGQLTLHDLDLQKSMTAKRFLENSDSKCRIDIAVDLKKDVVESASGIINATPIGMKKYPGTPIETNWILSSHWLIDIIYFPIKTELLNAVLLKDCHAISGIELAINQAEDAFKIFTGKSVDSIRFRQVFYKLVKERIQKWP